VVNMWGCAYASAGVLASRGVGTRLRVWPHQLYALVLYLHMRMHVGV
jgi:hypothetical protein